MGVTIESKNYTIDLGYSGFNNLRTKIAELTGPEIYEHYKNLMNGMFLIGLKSKKFFDDYNKKTFEIEESYNIPSGIMDFLYASDCDGNISYKSCVQIWEVIKNYDDDILYGYTGRDDCAMFKDFKKIINDCIENKCDLIWY